jgi:hypothetical protein
MRRKRMHGRRRVRRSPIRLEREDAALSARMAVKEAEESNVKAVQEKGDTEINENEQGGRRGQHTHVKRTGRLEQASGDVEENKPKSWMERMFGFTN